MTTRWLLILALVLIVPVLIVFFFREPTGEIDDQYEACMRDAGFFRYSEATVSSSSEGVVVLRIDEPDPAADTRQFITQSEACLTQLNSGGREELRIVEATP